MFKHVTITKRSLKCPGTAQEVLRHCGALATRGFTRAAKSEQQRRSIMASSLLPFFAGGEHHHYLQNNQKRSKSVVAFLSLFSVRLLFLQICQFWSRALHAPPADQACGWLDRQLPSSHFISATAVLSTAAMVVRSAPIQVSVLCPFFTALRPSFSIPHRLWRRDAAAGRLMVVSRERV